MQKNEGPWDNTDEEEVGWLTEAFDRLRDEVACMTEHWEAAKKADILGDDQEYGGQMYNLANHCENLSVGVGLVWKSLVGRYFPVEVVAELAREKLERIVGEPVDVVAQFGEDGVLGFLLERKGFDIPDDLSELEDE